MDPASGEERMPANFELNVMDESFIDGSSVAGLELQVEDQGSQVEVSVLATSAQNIKALYFDLGYDGTRYNPQNVEVPREFGSPDETLVLDVLQQRGRIYHGQVLTDYQEKDGFNGDGALAVVRFAKGPAPAGRIVSAPPVLSPSKPLLEFDADTFSLVWYFANQGDYDQNTETNAADLTPISANWHKTGPWDYTSVESVVDGDLNTEINISDITPIAQNFLRRVSSYNIYTAPTLDDFPAANDEAPKLEALASIPQADGEGDRKEVRLAYHFDLTGHPFDQYYWVRPADEGLDGAPSDALLHESTPLLPVMSLVATPTEGDVPLDVDFDASGTTSPLGDIASFSWDLDGDGEFGEADNGEDVFDGNAIADYTYADPAMYSPAVKVTGPKGLENTLSVDIMAAVTPPVADITGAPLTGKAPLTVGFDASGSFDPDGSIVLYEWDYNGDGTFDEETGSTPTTSYEFMMQGSYDTTVRVTDNHGATDTAAMSEAGGGALGILPPNVAPTAAISAAPLTGTIPLLVQMDASASIDSDGSIVSYEWDYEGDGTYDETTTIPAASHSFATAGDYDPTVRVTDNDGATDIAKLSDNMTGGLNVMVAPVADIEVSPDSGTVPLTVSMDASGSTDADGSIVLYEWDFEGDGTYDESGASATTSHEFTGGGDYNPTVRVTDDDGLTDVAMLAEGVGGIGITLLEAPTAALSATPLTGSAPLTVNFDASASTDADGTIVLYEWDWDGDGTYDSSGASATTSHAYTTGGDFDPAVRVTDDDGLTDLASLSDTIPGGLDILDPPVADIQATPSTGDYPLTVSFDASGSGDPDGSIVLYEWDLDYNGSYETNTGATDNVVETYLAKGTHSISVRVTDDDGLTDTASVDITLNTGFTTGTAVVSVSMDSKASIATFGTTPSEFAALSYKDASADDLYFVTATDSSSLTWNAPIAVLTSGQVGNECDLANIGGNPAIAYRRAATKLHYIYATASDGSAWGPDIEIANGGGAGAYSSLAYINGAPAISFVTSGQDDLYYVQATTSTGNSASDWPAPTQILAGGGGDEFEFTDMRAVNGNPAIGFNYLGADTGLKFIRATNASGTAWGSELEVDEPLGGGRWMTMDIVSGYPAMAYNAFDVDQLRYCRAVDADGSAAWGTPIVVDSGTDVGQWSTMAVSGGVPIIAYYDGGNADLKFARAADAVGSSWTIAVVDSEGDVGEYASITLVEGLPVIAYYDATNTSLKVAVLN